MIAVPQYRESIMYRIAAMGALALVILATPALTQAQAQTRAAVDSAELRFPLRVGFEKWRAAKVEYDEFKEETVVRVSFLTPGRTFILGRLMLITPGKKHRPGAGILGLTAEMPMQGRAHNFLHDPLCT